MPWILQDEEDNDEEVHSNTESSGKWEAFNEEPEFSTKRLAGSLARAAAIGPGIYGSMMESLGAPQGPLPGEKIRQQQEQDILTKLQTPGYVPSIGELDLLTEGTDEIPADLVPISQAKIEDLIDTTTEGRYIPQTGLEKILSSGVQTGSEFAALSGLLPIGGKVADQAMSGLRFGLGYGAAEEAGATEGGKFAAGIATDLSPSVINLLKKSPELAKSLWSTLKQGKAEIPGEIPKFLTEAGTEKALADLTLSAKDLSGRMGKVSDKSLVKLDNLFQGSPSTPLGAQTSFTAAEIEKEALKQNKISVLDTVSTKGVLEKDSWESVQKAVEDSFEKNKSDYSKLYDEVNSGARGITIRPTETFAAAKALSKDLSESLLKTTEEAGLKGTSDKLIKNLVNPTGELAEKLISDLKKEGIHADYKEVVSLLKNQASIKDVELSKLLATKRSINRILEKADIIPAPVNLLKRILKGLKTDIQKGLSKSPSLARKFNLAEQSFAKTQELFNNDVIVKLRKKDNPESLTRIFSSPSNKEKLNEALVNSPDSLASVERHIIENISNLSTESARKTAVEMGNYLSPNAKQALNTLIDAGDKLTSSGQQAITRGRILSDIQEAITTGKRPQATLDLMKTKNGYGLVKNSLSLTNQGEKAFGSLQRIHIQDALETTLDSSGKLDPKKLKDVLINPQTKKIIEDHLGKSGLEFFENLETYGKNFSKNYSILEKERPGFLDKLLEHYAQSGVKAILPLMLPFAGKAAIVGALPIVIKAGTDLIKRGNLIRILEKPNVINQIKRASKPNLNSASMASALTILASRTTEKNKNNME